MTEFRHHGKQPLDFPALAEFWSEGLDDSDDVGTDVAKLAQASRRIAVSRRHLGGHVHARQQVTATRPVAEDFHPRQNQRPGIPVVVNQIILYE
jgi:hypothetical protein